MGPSREPEPLANGSLGPDGFKNLPEVVRGGETQVPREFNPQPTPTPSLRWNAVPAMNTVLKAKLGSHPGSHLGSIYVPRKITVIPSKTKDLGITSEETRYY
jgi:hypothetical protein